MAISVFDRAKESCTGTGTGDITLTETAFEGFNLISEQLLDSSTVDLLLLDTDNPAVGWEVVRCTFTLSTKVLARATGTILSSSNGGAALDLSANTHSVGIVNSAHQIASLTVLENRAPLDASMYGMAYDKQDLDIAEAAGTLYLEVEKVGGGDVNYLINGVKSTLDCTTGAGIGGKARVALTAGTDSNTLAQNHLYATDSGGTASLVASTSLPTGAFAWVGKVVVPDAVTWGIFGSIVFQRYTDTFDNDSRGALSHEREKLRQIGALYIDGIAQTLNITTNAGSMDTVHLATGAGTIYQLHRQNFPAFSTGLYFQGNGLTPYDPLYHLGEMSATQDGTAFANRDRLNIVVGGLVNITTGECKLFANAPSGVYSTDADAMSDPNMWSDYTVADDLKSVAFLIARIALKYEAADSGTWTELGVYSLLGTPVGARAGGGGSVASQEFDDSLLRVYSTGDSSSKLQFDISQVAAATTRTVTMPDEDVDLGDVGDATSLVVTVLADGTHVFGNRLHTKLLNNDFSVTLSQELPLDGKTAKTTGTLIYSGTGVVTPIAGMKWAAGAAPDGFPGAAGAYWFLTFSRMLDGAGADEAGGWTINASEQEP